MIAAGNELLRVDIARSRPSVVRIRERDLRGRRIGLVILNFDARQTR